MSFKWKQMKISLVLQKIFYIGITYFENWLTYWFSGFVLKWNKMIVNHLKSGMYESKFKLGKNALQVKTQVCGLQPMCQWKQT